MTDQNDASGIRRQSSRSHCLPDDPGHSAASACSRIDAYRFSGSRRSLTFPSSRSTCGGCGADGRYSRLDLISAILPRVCSKLNETILLLLDD